MAHPVWLTCVFVLAPLILLAQSTPVFEVASIRLNPPGITGGRLQFPPGGKCIGSNVALDFLIQQAYGVSDYQIIGPGWLPVNRFEIEAQAADHSVGTEVLKQMLQNLLAERFHLKLHRETRELPVLELTVDKGGVKIQPLTAAASEKYAGHTGLGWNRDGIIANNVPFASLADGLRRELGRPILDSTGLNDRFDFIVKYDQRLSRSDGGDPAADSSGTSIFVALREQLGLRLDSRKAPIGMLVIDSVDKTPTAN